MACYVPFERTTEQPAETVRLTLKLTTEENYKLTKAASCFVLFWELNRVHCVSRLMSFYIISGLGGGGGGRGGGRSTPRKIGWGCVGCFPKP